MAFPEEDNGVNPVESGLELVSRVKFGLSQFGASYNTTLNSVSETATDPRTQFSANAIYDEWIGSQIDREDSNIVVAADNITINKATDYVIDLVVVIKSTSGSSTRFIQLVLNNQVIAATAGFESSGAKVEHLHITWKGSVEEGDQLKLKTASTSGITSVCGVNLYIDQD